MLSEIPDDEFAAAVDGCAAEVLWEAEVAEPPVDTLLVAERLRLAVTRDFSMPCRGRFVRLAGYEDHGDTIGTIVVGQAERPEREQWAVAHEIGESVAHRVFERLGVLFDESLSTAREQVANRLANALMLPRRWFAIDGIDRDWDLSALKERYSTASHELIARRMLEMRPPVVITIFDQGRITWRRSNATARAPGLLEEEFDAWRAAHDTDLASDRTMDGERGLERVRCWPVHEPGWKREILRSEVAEW
ncbi:MAG TPA: ImmA/IrrE family metallo-endopeptidase [Lacipirellulaceae bacterium]|nr:ImmA/IrrE family metallo-endopeptidase [Lacipirellulaceae bacterium]